MVIFMSLFSWPNYLIYIFFSLPPTGGGGVWPASFRHVSVEPAGPASSLHVFLAAAVCAADLLLLQHQRQAHLQRETPLPLPHQVTLLRLILICLIKTYSFFLPVGIDSRMRAA